MCAGLPKLEFDPMLKAPQVVRRGNKLIMQVDFTGVPLPRATWSLNDVTLSPSAKVNIDTSEYCTVLEVRDFGQADVGTYKVTVNNTAGSKSASFDTRLRGEQITFILI